MGNLSLNGSRLLDETGGLARISGVIASLVIVAIVLTGLDLPGLVPVPILAGLLMYLGLVVLTEVLLRSPAHRAWTDFGLALLIMGAIVTLGYLAGVVFGFIAACLTFAFSYSRIAVIRRHLTRVVYASQHGPLRRRRAPAAGRRRAHSHLLAGGVHLLRLVQWRVREHPRGDRENAEGTAPICRARFHRRVRLRYLGAAVDGQAQELRRRPRRDARLRRALGPHAALARAREAVRCRRRSTRPSTRATPRSSGARSRCWPRPSRRSGPAPRPISRIGWRPSSAGAIGRGASRAFSSAAI